MSCPGWLRVCTRVSLDALWEKHLRNDQIRSEVGFWLREQENNIDTKGRQRKKPTHITLSDICYSIEMHHSLLYETPNDACMFDSSLNKNSILTQKFNADHILSCGAELHALKPQHWCSKYKSSGMNEWYVLVVKMHLQGESGSGFLEKPLPQGEVCHR